MKVAAAILVFIGAAIIVLAPGDPPIAQASHPKSPTLLWRDLEAAGDHTIGYATCPESYPPSWDQGIEQSWDAIFSAWDFYQVVGCNSNVVIDFEGQFGYCEAPPVNRPNAVGCVITNYFPHGFHRDITSPQRILFDVNHPQGHYFRSWGPNWQRAIVAHEWAHVLGLEDHVNPDQTEQDMCVVNSIVGYADISKKATDNPCFVAPTSPDVGSVVCNVYGCHPNGTFVNTPTTVYVIEGNQKRKFWDPAILDSWSDFSDVVAITDSEAAAYLDGPEAGFRPGKLISSGGAVFLISNDGPDLYRRQKRHVISPTVLSQCFPGLPSPTPIAPIRANNHTTGPDITGCVPTHPGGSVVFVPNDAVYFINSNQPNQRRWVISQGSQNSWRFGPDLIQIAAQERNIYTLINPPIGFRPGRLIVKNSTQQVFFISNEGDFGMAIKRHVANSTTFNCLFPGEPLTYVSDFEADSHPTGASIQIPGC